MEPTNKQTAQTTPKPISTPVTSNTTPSIKNDTLMGVLCYLGPLVIIPYMTAKENPFVKFHVKQGIVLFGIELAIYVLGSMFIMSGLFALFSLLNLGALVLTIIGIINVVGKKEVPLPLIGKLADSVKI